MKVIGREAAKQMFRDDKNSQGCYRSVMTKIDMIYDNFELLMNKEVVEALNGSEVQDSIIEQAVMDYESFCNEHGLTNDEDGELLGYLIKYLNKLKQQ